MIETIGNFLPVAVGIAISPLPIAAIILMLLSGRALSNGLSFLVGWIGGITVVGTIVLVLGDVSTDDGGPSTTSGWIKLGLGVALLGLALRSFRHRPGPDDEPEVPSWMAAIDGISPVKAVGLGALLSAVNPKNLALTVAGTSIIASTGLSGGDQAMALVVFVVIAVSTVTAPMVIYLAARDQADQLLAGLKDWLMANNATVMMVLLAVFGFKLVGDGIAILS